MPPTVSKPKIKPLEISKLRPWKILVVDDNPTNQKVATFMLKQLGFTNTKTAIDGKEALERAIEEQYDLIFMDIMMPVMDGYEATRQIRFTETKQQTKRAVIIAITANAVVGEKERCLEAGMDDCLPKPVSPERFQEVLTRFLGDK